ncbi:ABC-2 type transport system permease protein [Streptoalloteichus tenebrarius]|uniref:Transport permease protein n=1 Tax=Streptoalloteichus tenebrarius (strain ATCC 17920 / DSM 40477 / JCM 4838 / CBS 697.72 / NBRC 16177 / NCIMB 11028 / NRRL B-12390 / A12253. 1 / ISP 5477) TaxID=1933 RepID=A0ABT1HRW6_STRSD|nr:ABC transporter permease [Streptoalloteichus tenebrarius]MCP2258261.1 ABC-2 type transport system permease protein [Streptoalloteichus tenebrarius]BFF04509.1 ABC transporter permease [Streptoalloteichus tenebrarius]
MFRDVRTVFSREFAPVLREPLSLIFAMGQPLLFLFLFGSILSGTPGLGDGGPAWQWFVPGILVMMCLSGPMMAGYSLLVELLGGSMERMLVTPLNRTAMLVGRTLKEFVILLAQAVLIIVLAVPLGFRPHLAGALAGLVVLVVFGTGLGALSFLLAIRSQPSGQLFWTLTQMVLYPLMLLSGMMLPVEYGPAWLRVIAAFNPVSHIVDAERALFAGRFGEISVLYGGVAALAIAVVGLWLGTRAMRRGV